MLSFLFGFATFPIYSLCAAHASDFVEQDRMLTLSASLIFLYATGAIISPLAAGIIIENFGAAMMFAMIAVAHLCSCYTPSTAPLSARQQDGAATLIFPVHRCLSPASCVTGAVQMTGQARIRNSEKVGTVIFSRLWYFDRRVAWPSPCILTVLLFTPCVMRGRFCHIVRFGQISAFFKRRSACVTYGKGVTQPP